MGDQQLRFGFVGMVLAGWGAAVVENPYLAIGIIFLAAVFAELTLRTYRQE